MIGLLGLVMFTAEQRTKELGIRKVLGASPTALFNLLPKEFLQLVLIAFVIASPLAWLTMNNWLQNYAYKVAISWWMFVIAGITAIKYYVSKPLQVDFLFAILFAICSPKKAVKSETKESCQQ